MSLAYLRDVCHKFSGNINLDKKIIFIHVPKCAGNSIKKAIVHVVEGESIDFYSNI